MQNKAPHRKKAVNVSIDAELAAEAKAFGTNMSAVLEKALSIEHREKRWAKWREENKAAIDTHNKFIEEHGAWGEKYRSW